VQAAAELRRDRNSERCADCMRCDLYKEFIWDATVSLTFRTPIWAAVVDINCPTAPNLDNSK
jgi:hypothetical protein